MPVDGICLELLGYITSFFVSRAGRELVKNPPARFCVYVYFLVRRRDNMYMMTLRHAGYAPVPFLRTLCREKKYGVWVW